MTVAVGNIGYYRFCRRIQPLPSAAPLPVVCPFNELLRVDDRWRGDNDGQGALLVVAMAVAAPGVLPLIVCLAGCAGALPSCVYCRSSPATNALCRYQKRSELVHRREKLNQRLFYGVNRKSSVTMVLWRSRRIEIVMSLTEFPALPRIRFNINIYF